MIERHVYNRRMANTPVIPVRIDPRNLDLVRDLLDMDYQASNSEIIRAAITYVIEERQRGHRLSRIRSLLRS
jgi:Arc/MetJ-type ribon-helix-helix transcriptional regulator